MQMPEPSTIEALLKTVGAPAATFFMFVLVFRKLLLPKANGAAAARLEITAKELAEAQTKEMLYRMDVAMTDHFDQLRRDLEAKIEKTMENRLTAYLFRQELDRPSRKEPR